MVAPPFGEIAKPTQLAGQSQGSYRPANRRRTTQVPTLPAPEVD